ncbi:hypothetical protein [Mucilaginibacter sp. UR6-11]|uniref:hypothetical protein n=1 Tax=Mucilaginibacter sp. UR6-11 TaxID=1435644 RepID=UPI001E43D3F3|nr:hypothetical protein [Mucilaginibacter sp. UR6-11]MCC8423777.1 hypothetical protein [Mucilaginibacter sp. UR6-11]
MKYFFFFSLICGLFLSRPDYLHAQSVEDRHAKAIRLALEAGGINTASCPPAAKDYGPFLIKIGFDTVGTANYKPIPGDIRVFQPYPKGETSGFIDMFDGQIWISEYKEDGFWPTPQYEKYKPKYQIFRWVKK